MQFNILNGHSFAKIADYVFATYIKRADGQEGSVFYLLNLGLLEDGDVIYCKTDFVLNLFDQIKNLDVGLTIITHESDYHITKEMFDRRPKCVKKWYAINVAYDHQDLIPIPLGISNSNCVITLKFDRIKESKHEKSNLLYLNHRSKTNPKKREWLYDWLKDKEWCTVRQPNLSLADFEIELNKHEYMLCPPGNGTDTHRLWECLYSGITPVVEKHQTHKNLNDLPILFVDSFRDITKNLLLDNLELLKNKNLDRLNVYYWRELIKKGKS